MYVLVQHVISEPAAFWNAVDLSALSSDVTLHYSFPTPDGTRAACVWEARSIERLQAILEPIVGRYSSNEYLAVENREGFAMPSGVPKVATSTRKRTRWSDRR
jgi:hypothetical protein